MYEGSKKAMQVPGFAEPCHEAISVPGISILRGRSEVRSGGLFSQDCQHQRQCYIVSAMCPQRGLDKQVFQTMGVVTAQSRGCGVWCVNTDVIAEVGAKTGQQLRRSALSQKAKLKQKKLRGLYDV